MSKNGNASTTIKHGSRITALMPVKNYHARYLEEALDSVFGQTSSEWLLKVIVEPKDAATMATVLESALCDSRVSLIVNQGQRLAGAFNSGMRAAETPFVAILLADDRWELTAVEILNDCIGAHPEADFFHSGLRVIDEHGEFVSPVRHPSRDLSLGHFIEGEAVKHLLCWRLNKALAVGGMDESINDVGPDDYDFPWTMFESGARFHAVDECLYDYRDHRDTYRLTTHLPRSTHLERLRRILEKHSVPGPVIASRLRYARRAFLRQCLFRNRLDKWLKERVIGIDPSRGWRENYNRWDARNV
jgi:glycosyltransferase involved in cell wall biosynthesis